MASMSSSLRAERPGLVLTAIGPDRPGLVNALAGFVSRRGGNIEDTRMAKLGGEFAVLMLVTGTSAALGELEQDQRAIEAELGISCSFKPTHSAPQSPGARAYRLRISATDRPGIVEGLSQLLAARGVNVASLSSRVVHAPLTGTPLFELEADLELPAALVIAEFRRALDEVAERENIDHELAPLRS